MISSFINIWCRHHCHRHHHRWYVPSYCICTLVVLFVISRPDIFNYFKQRLFWINEPLRSYGSVFSLHFVYKILVYCREILNDPWEYERIPLADKAINWMQPCFAKISSQSNHLLLINSRRNNIFIHICRSSYYGFWAAVLGENHDTIKTLRACMLMKMNEFWWSIFNPKWDYSSISGVYECVLYCMWYM